MRVALSLAIAALLVFPVAAGVKVDHEDGVDFKSYRTYAWKPGTEAARPAVQEAIVRAVERELEARGLRKVTDRTADVYVVTVAFGEMDASVRGKYVYVNQWDVGVITSDVVATTTGKLIVDLIDGESDRPVWRGMITEVMSTPDEAKILRKIDKLTRKMFKSFPPD